VLKKFFGFERRDSMSQVLTELSLPSADTVIYNSVLFHKQYTTCENNIVAWFVSIDVWILCVIRCISLIGLVILFLLFLFVFVTMDYVWNKLDGWTFHGSRRHLLVQLIPDINNYDQELTSCWDGRPLHHNRHGPKSGGCCAPFFFGGELCPYLTWRHRRLQTY